MKNIMKKWWFWTIITCIIFVVVAVFIKFKEQRKLEETAKKIGESASDFYTGIQEADTHLDEFTYNYETGEVEYKTDTSWLDKYELIRVGMSREEVEQILGEGFKTPDIEDESFYLNWGEGQGLDKGQVITVHFTNNRVTNKTKLNIE